MEDRYPMPPVEPGAAAAWTAIVGAIGGDASLTLEFLPVARELSPKLDDVLAGRDVAHVEHHPDPNRVPAFAARVAAR